MAFVWRTIGLAALAATVPTAGRAADPAPQGTYQADVLGPVELHSDKDRLMGFSTGGGPCGFSAHQTVLEGQLQGRVMVGRMTVCLQGGAACGPSQELPVLAFYDAEDRSLSTWIRPPEGCKVARLGTSEAEGGVVVLRPAALTAATARGGLELPASVRKERPSADTAREALAQGKKLMERKEWKGAAEAFERSIWHNGDHADERSVARGWTAYVNLGTVRLMQEQPEQALWALQKALTLSPQHPHAYRVHYAMACAYGQLHDKAQAMEQFQLAVDSGLPLSEGSQDLKLDTLLGSDVGSYREYTLLLQHAADNFHKDPTQTRQISEP